MKKIVIFTLTLLVCLSTLVSCAQNALLNRQGGLYDEKEQIYYSYAPMSVEAISYSPKAHIVDAYGYTYHPVYDMKNNKCSTSDLLYEPDGHTLIYNSEMGFPTILEFEASSAIFYISGDSDQRLSSVDDAAETVKLTEVFRNPSIEYPGISATDTYKLRFFSEKYPYFAFVFTYVEYSSDYIVDVKVDSLEGYVFEEGVTYEQTQNADGSWTVSYNYGKYFLYDRDSGLCYMAGYIHDKYNTAS